jgi:subfamily B ATP-binding cassette protein MsbA
MAIGGPSATRVKKSKKGANPLHFMRVLAYSRPYKKYLYPGVISVIIFALTYSIGISALLPVIHIMAGNQGVPAWVHQGIAERRLGVTLYFDEQDQQISLARRGSNSLIPNEIGKDNKLIAIDGKEQSSSELLRTLAYAETGKPLSLTFHKDDTGDRTVAVKSLPPIRWDNHSYWMRRGAALLPQGTDKQSKMATLKLILFTVLAISIIGGIARFFSEYLIALGAACTVVSMRRRMYRRVLNLPVSKFATHGVSDLISRFLQDSQDVYRGMNFIFAKSLREPLKAVFVFALALFIDWRLTLITVVSAPIGGYIIVKFGKMVRKANKRVLQSYGHMVSALQGSLMGIRVVKGYTMESFERRRLHSVDKAMLRQQLKIEFIDALSSPLFELVGQLVGVFAILYFARQMFDGLMEISKFATLGACMAGMFDPIRKFSSFNNRWQTANAALDRVFEVIDMPDETSGGRGERSMPAFSESIEFRNISFNYPGATIPALDQINLTIRRGERIAFVGPNGSGKTTLLSVLMGFFEPQKGSLLVDGRDVREYSMVSLRRQMSLLTQDTVLFADSIAHNIAYGDDRLIRKLVLQKRHPERKYDLNGDDQRIQEAARRAYADEFIREKPQGYDTYVGEQGVALSGGQKQRIAIARAILRNAPIFIFDEATSQVDSESEHKIHDAVEKFLEGRTALIIAHRFSTILQADRIVVMDRGRIVDVGRHEELIQRCRLYQGLYGTQILDDSTGETQKIEMEQEKPISQPA